LKWIANRNAIASLCLARTAYAVNWYNVAAIFSLIALDFKENVGGLGLITGSFYVGLGLFQVPGGIVAARYGPRTTTIYGILVASLAALLTGFTTDFTEIILLRFFVGVGMAFFFAPGVVLVAKYFRKDSGGLAVGTFNSVFYLGGALGVFGWAVLAEIVGWRLSLVTSGALGILTGLFLFFSVPKDSLREDFLIKWSELRKVLADRWLLLLTLELFGMGSGSTVTTTFIVYYLENTVGVGVALAGVVGGLALIFALPSALLVGRLYDSMKDVRKLLLLSGLTMSFGIAIAALGSLWSAAVSAVAVGLSSGAAFTVGFSAAREGQIVAREYETLAVSWVNSISLFAGFFSPVAFSLLVLRVGYSSAWLVAALYTLTISSTILMYKRKSPRA
jgi:MFS family permease